MLPKIPEIVYSQSQGIPKLIHQTWKTSEVPKHWQASVEGWGYFVNDLGWHYVLWTDEMNREFVQTHYGWFLPQFDSYKRGIQRADVVRYFILHFYGGIYCDLDIAPKKSFLDLFKMYEHEHLIFAKSASSHHLRIHPFTNAFMMSVPKHDFWKLVITELQHPLAGKPWYIRTMSKISRHFKVIFTTGPGVINSSYKKYLEKNPSVRFAGIPMEYVQPLQEWEGRPGSTADAKVTLLPNGSWHKDDSEVMSKISQMWGEHRDLFYQTIILLFFVLFLTFAILYAKKK
jgi:mannosyltransferase OCH1-like enzyme